MSNVKKTFIGLVVVVGLSVAAAPTERYFEIAKNLDIFATLFKEVNAFYVDEVDPTQLIRTGIDAMLGSLDPYTNYIPEEEIENFRTMTTGQYAGIGALIGSYDGKTVITMPYEGFAADKAGLKIGDEILKINGKDVTDKSIPEISELLKGQARTTVDIQVVRPGTAEPLNISVKREKITIGNVPYYGKVEGNVGYIKLEDFTPNAGKEVGHALDELKKDGITSVILDLRNNPGGLLSEAVNVSNIFISKNKEVVSTVGKVKEWNKTYKTLNHAVDTEIPLVVLANGGSASAAEIVSGVIQDYDRGLLLGQTTFGKGLVQTTRPLTYNSQLKVTTAKYYIPSGRCIQALDYSHRAKNGSVNRVVDSLKNSFFTKNGRVVKDGEGLTPDIEVKLQRPAAVTIALFQQGMFFKYANQFAVAHDKIPIAKNFELSDAEYQKFVTWVKEQGFGYKSNFENELQELRASAKDEKYFNDIEAQINVLEKTIIERKEQDFIKHQEEIELILEDEIASRFYLQKGSIEASLEEDPEVQKAVELLNDQQHYAKLLSSQ